ncbi:MAG TPA: hypothetical protein DIC42_06150 [Holosporales bacterium]|nr:hypothetical protein [Holosporales bacterium]
MGVDAEIAQDIMSVAEGATILFQPLRAGMTKVEGVVVRSTVRTEGGTAATKAAGQAEASGASSAFNAELLKKQFIAEQISKGHSFEKHILSQGEFPSWIRTTKQLQHHIETVLNDPVTTHKTLNEIRSIYVHRPSHSVIIHNVGALDRGTIFQPKTGIDGFLQSSKWK